MQPYTIICLKTVSDKSHFMKLRDSIPGGYSYIEPYLVQDLSADTRKVNYNNYGEVGTGLRFHANIPFFPVLFVQPTYRSYFYGGLKNSFTIQGGFEFIFRTPL